MTIPLLVVCAAVFFHLGLWLGIARGWDEAEKLFGPREQMLEGALRGRLTRDELSKPLSELDGAK
jgi:hypothetical protein